MYVHVLSYLLLCCIFEENKKLHHGQKRKLRYTLLCYVVELAVGSEQKLNFCYDSSDPVGPSMIPTKTIVIEQVRRGISSVKQAYVKLACNRVISPGISHIACESFETAIRTFLCLVVYFQSFAILLRMLV